MNIVEVTMTTVASKEKHYVQFDEEQIALFNRLLSEACIKGVMSKEQQQAIKTIRKISFLACCDQVEEYNCLSTVSPFGLDRNLSILDKRRDND